MHKSLFLLSKIPFILINTDSRKESIVDIQRTYGTVQIKRNKGSLGNNQILFHQRELKKVGQDYSNLFYSLNRTNLQNPQDITSKMFLSINFLEIV